MVRGYTPSGAPVRRRLKQFVQEPIMGSPFRFALCLFVASYPCALSRSDERPQAPKAPPLTCTIRSGHTCELGKAPAIAVEIANWTEGDIYLIGSLDGSDHKWRFPLCYFEVIGPNGKSAVQTVARCGNMNAIRGKDFVKVPRGGKFDPYQKIDDLGFFASSLISPTTFRAEGEYRIRFIYSTDRVEPKYWLGDVNGDTAEMLPTEGNNEKVVKLLAKVPKTTISSNEISVKVVRPNK
jgi:hypothetical protein